MTVYGGFDNSTFKKVLNLLEPGDPRLGEVVMRRVAVVKLGVNNGSGDGGGCCGIEADEIWLDYSSMYKLQMSNNYSNLPMACQASQSSFLPHRLFHQENTLATAVSDKTTEKLFV